MKLATRFRCVFQDKLSDYITAIAWSSRNNSFAAISAAGDLVQWQPTSPQSWNRIEIQPTRTHPNRSTVRSSLNCLGFSSDGQFLAVGGQAGKLLVGGIQTGQFQPILDQSFPSIWLDQLAWHPTQNHLAVGIGRQVYLWDVPHSKPFLVLEFESSSVLGLAWHPSGRYLAVSGNGGVKIWDLQNHQTLPTVLEVPGASLCARWSPQGKFLASGNLDRTLSVLDWENPPPWLMQGFPGKVSQVAWADSPAPLLAAISMDGITIWQKGRDQNWSSHVLTEHQGSVRDIVFQPRGNLLISAGEGPELMVWNQAKTLLQKLKGPTQGTHCLTWNDAGAQIAVGGKDGTMMIFELQKNCKGFG